MKNPLSNGQIVTSNTDYLKRDQKRGDIDYPMSRSDLMDFAKCPSKWRRSHRTDDRTVSTDFGNLIDTLLTQPDKFMSRFAVEPATYIHIKEATKNKPEVRTEKKWNNNAEVCRIWTEAQGDKLTISQDELDSAKAAIERLKVDDSICEYLTGAKFQVFIQAEYQDAATGIVIPIRCLPDMLPTNPKHARKITDFKTARNADLKSWNRVVDSYDYDAQGAMYLDAYNSTAEGKASPRDIFTHIIQESEPPFETATPMLSEEFLNSGRKKYLSALRLYCQCLERMHWPGYNELHRVQIGGMPIIEPDNYMLLKQTSDDPDWMDDEQERKEIERAA